MKNISKKTTSHYNPILWLLAFLLSMSLLSNRVNAQVSGNPFSGTDTMASSWSYITLGGGASLISTVSTGCTDDDYGYTPVTIPFSFPYGGSTFTSVGVSANGYIMLGGSTTNWYSNAVGSAANTIAIINSDLQGGGLTNSAILYQTIGTSPNRKFIIQYRDWTYYPYSTYTGTVFSCQVVLNEDGRVQVQYNNCTALSSSISARNSQVGISGSTTSLFSVLNSSTTWAAATQSTTSTSGTMTYSSAYFPDNGRRYTWGNAPAPQVIDSVKTIQVSNAVPLGGTAQAVIAVVFYTHGSLNPKNVSAILCNTTGTTSTSDISNAKIYYTGTTSTYTSAAVLRQFGTTTFASPSGAMYFTSPGDTLAAGANYYWLVYDITTNTSSGGNVVDAQCTIVTDTATHAPSITNPAGSRQIAAPMNGIYTINPSGSGTNNYTSIDNAIIDMQNRTIVGPVTFLLSAATYTYTTPLILPCITGASAINTITFDGGNGNAATRVITGSLTNLATVYMNCNYYTLRNLTVSNSYGSGCGGIGVVTGTVGNTINNCIVSTGSLTSMSSAIFSATSTTDYYGSGPTTVDSLTIDSNTISVAYYGINLYGNSSTTSNRNYMIRHNNVSNIYNYGMYIQYNYGNMDVNYNTVTMSPSYGYMGFYMYGNTNSSTQPSNMIGNKVSAYYYTMYIYFPGGSTAANTFNFYNNMIIGASATTGYYGLYFYNSNNYSQIYHNTVLMPFSYSSTSYAGMSINGSSYTSVKNNVIVNSATSGSAINLYCSTAIPNDSVNFNVYYNNSNGTLVYNNGSSYGSSSFNTATAGGSGSYNMMPSFVSATDLHLASGCSVPTGTDLTTFVPQDFDRNTRPTTPRIGCAEASFLSVDMAMNAIVSPASPVGTGSATVSVRIQNMGTTTITVATVGYQFNGSAPVTTTWTGTLPICGTAVVTFGTPITLLSTNTLKTWVSPLSVTDLNHNNDTINAAINAAMAGGIYTINGSSPTSGTNFQTFQAAISALSNGILGSITFNVAAGTYTQTTALVIPVIAGASATSTITFEGGNGNAATRIITGSVASTGIVYIASPYVTFHNLTVNNTYTSNCGGIGILATATGCKISRCLVNLTILTTTSSCIYNASSTTDYYGSSGTPLDSITIDSNICTGGYYGIKFYGTSSGSANRNYKIRGNSVAPYYYGIYLYYIYNNIDLMYNTVNMSPLAGYYGIYFMYCTNGSSLPTNVIGNKIMNAYAYSFYCYYPGGSTAANTFKFYNNMIIGGNTTNPYNYYGIYYYNNNNYAQLWHNTILMPYSYSSTQYSSIYANGSSYTSIKNNILVNTASSGPACNLYCATSIPNDSVNFNVYYNSSNTNVVYNGGTFTNATNFNTASAGGDSSVYQLPTFVNNANDLHLSGPCSAPTGQDLTYYVSTDFDQFTRSTPPRIGCSEPSFVTNDLAMDSMTSPIPPIVSGTGTAITVRIRNSGSTPIFAAQLYYQFNGGTPVSTTWTGTLTTCATSTATFSTGITLGAVNSFKVWTAVPNGSVDNNRANDTLVYTYFTPMSGTYTINASAPTAGTNFQTFTTAINTIKTAGMAGPVVFSVLAGTYNEQAIVSGTILGLSAVNTLTFDGGNGNAATRILTFAASGQGVFMVNQVKYINIRNLTITNSVTAGTACIGVALIGTGSSYNTTGCSVVGCIVNVPNPGGTSSTGYGISITASANGNGATAMGADSITIDSNTINGSAYAISFYGSTNATYNRGIRIRYNRVTGANYYGVSVSYIYNPLDFIGNYVHMNSSYGYMGVYFNSNTNSSTTQPTRFNGNTIDNWGGYGVYFSNPGGTSTAPVQLYNNQIINYPTSYGGSFGVYNVGGSYVEVYHNTIVMGNGSYGFYNTVSNVWIKNNIFGVTTSSTSTYPIYCSTSPTSGQLDYNNYYNTSGGTNLGYNGGTYTSSTYKTASALGANSYNFTPGYANPSLGNYALSSNCGAAGVDLISTGTSYTVGHDSIDITGLTRTNPPTIGAYQFNGTANDLAVVSIASPTFPISAGSQSIVVNLANTGTTTIYSSTMWLKLNGGTPVSVAYAPSGGIAPCAVGTVTFTGVTLLAGNNTLKIYSSLPNSATDGNRSNDTINKTLGTPMSGTYTINLAAAISGTNYQTFEAAVNDLNGRGVSGSCLFNVSSGTYNPVGGSLIFNNTSTLGLSATNTVIFKSLAGVPDSVIVNGNGGGYILNFNTASYINFKYISFVQPTSSGVINFAGNSNYDTIYNCKLTMPPSSGSGFMVNLTGFVTGVTVRKCNIQGGYYGFYAASSTWNTLVTLDSNILNAQYYPAYFIYCKNLKFNANTVYFGTGVSTSGGLMTQYVDSASEFAYNSFTTPNSGTNATFYAMYYGCAGNATQHILFHHNKVDATGSNSYIQFYYPGYNGVYIDYYNNYLNLGNGNVNGYIDHLGYQSTNVRFYNNTVYTSAAQGVVYYNYITNNMDIQNNVFYNSGIGYAFAITNAAPGSTEFFDNNNYYAAGNTTPIYGFTGGYTVSQWKSLTANTAVLRDKNSIQYAPGFTNYTTGSVNLAPNTSDSSVWSLNGRGLPASWITTDILGNARSSSVTTGSTDIGCYEFTPNAGVLPPLATPSGAPAAGSTQTFTFGGDVVASITWPSLVTVPTSVGVRVYPQSTPPQLGTLNSAWQYTNTYWNITAFPAGTYTWNPTLTYKDQWLKNVPNKTNMVWAGKYPTTSWTAGVVSTGLVIDTINDLISPTATSVSANITNAYFVGTIATNPLPVQLDKITAVRSGNNGLVSWTTASEINSDYFIVERSIDGVNFTQEGTVKASGNSTTANSYTFTDMNVVSNNPTANTIYYRLKMVDMDGSSELSSVVNIKISNSVAVGTTVYPNPFINELNITVNATRNTTAKIEIVDIQGRLIAVKSVDINKGDTKVTVSELSNLNAGIYFVNMIMNGETTHAKVIKN